MGRFSDLSVEQLQTEIADYRAAIKAVSAGGGVGVVAAEGRRVEYVGPNVDHARRELRDLLAELARRPGFEDRKGTGAIELEIG